MKGCWIREGGMVDGDDGFWMFDGEWRIFDSSVGGRVVDEDWMEEDWLVACDCFGMGLEFDG